MSEKLQSIMHIYIYNSNGNLESEMSHTQGCNSQWLWSYEYLLE